MRSFQLLQRFVSVTKCKQIRDGKMNNQEMTRKVQNFAPFPPAPRPFPPPPFSLSLDILQGDFEDLPSERGLLPTMQDCLSGRSSDFPRPRPPSALAAFLSRERDRARGGEALRLRLFLDLNEVNDHFHCVNLFNFRSFMR